MTTYTYDSRGRQLTTTTPEGKTVTKTYDALGLALTTTDEENRVTTFGYDAASQLASVTDALNQITRYSYDPAGNKISQTDANNHAISYAYDNLNRRTRRTLPLSQFEQYTYDAVGNMASRTDFNGKTASYGYDSLNRLLNRTPDASFGATPVTYTYTATGQRLTMTDASGATTYTYTNRDQLAAKATPQGTLTYVYDPVGNVTSTVSSNTNGTSVSYAWDANNRLSAVTDARTGGTTNYSYDATNQLSPVQYPNGVAHAYGYDSRDRLLTLGVNGPGGVLANYVQTYSFTSHKQSVTEASGRIENYSYDPIYRLLNQGISGDPTPANNGSLGYTLDAVGNRLSLASTLAALQSQTKTYDANDRMSGDTSDANGNTLTSGGHTFAYDFEDRLTQFDTSSVTMVYDGDGNRVARTEAGVTTRYLIDDLTPTGYAQVAEELVGGSVVAQYTHGLMRISQRRLTGGTFAASYYGYDGAGSVRQLFDSTGAVTDTYAYDAYGNTVARTGSTVNPYQYRGEQYDASLRMYYLRARWHRPDVGRFLTQDSYEGDDEKPASLHRYLYANANPVDGRDPSGESMTENALAIQFGNVTRSVFAVFTTAMGGVTLGEVIAGAKLAHDAICCLDLAWSVLDLASGTHQPALDLIDEACKIGCNIRAFLPGGTNPLLLFGVMPWDVGPVNELRNRSQPGDGLDIHHAPQSAPSQVSIPGYDPNTAPGIAVPEIPHRAIPTLPRIPIDPKDLIKRTMDDLRRVGAPACALRELRDLIKQKYPGIF